MNNYIKKNFNLLLNIFILLHPIIDLITGICLHVFNLNLTFGNIIRIIFLMFVMFCTIFVYKKKKPLIYYIIFGVYFFSYFISLITIKDGIGLFTEIQGLIRTFYFPIMLLSLYEIREEVKVSIKTLTITLCTYILCIFIRNWL